MRYPLFGPLRYAALFVLANRLVLGADTQATAASGQVLTGHIPPATVGLRAVGGLPATQQMQLAIGLPLRKQDALSRLLVDLYDPASPRYHQFLTPEQFTGLFGPSEEDYRAVTAFAEAAGLHVTARHANRMLLNVSGSVADIEKALHTSFRQFQHPTEARTFFAPEVEPSLALSVPVLHISGLSDFELPRPAISRVTPIGAGGGGVVPADGSGPNGLYRGNDFRHAYAQGVALNGAGQFLGLLEFDSYYPADIATYRSQTGVLTVPLIDVYIDGANSAPGQNNIEVALDIEVAMSMAPGLAAIIVYQATFGFSPNDILNRIATDNIAKQLSASWTFPTDATSDQIFQEYAAQGQSYFNSSGDHGAYTGNVSSPADRPFVISVGGTTLSSSGTGGSWLSETTWNWNSTGSGTDATGGGVSTIYPIPSWQQGVPSLATNGGSTAMRNIPDVAMIGDATYVVYGNGQSGGVGGTSVSSPLWAAFTALVNQQAVSLGQPPVGFLNPAFYAIGTSPGYSTNFHDITTGNNTNTASPTRFYATGSFDLCTGWGSPIGANLINTLAPRVNARLVINSGATILTEGCSPGNGAVDPGETVTVNLSLKNIGAVKVTNLVATLQADSGVLLPSGPQTFGALNSGGTAVSRSFTFTASGACGSALVSTLQLQDGSASLGTASFTFPLGKPTSALAQNFDTVAAPALPAGWTTLTAGGGVGWITSSTLRDTSPNAAFAAEPVDGGVTDLVSPVFPITTSTAQLSFRQNFNFESDPAVLSNAFDGGVLEIRIGGGPFQDILTAGGSFVTNGYNRSISPTNTDNPLFGRQVWSALSGGFITTTANLPAAAAGQTVQLKWRLGTDIGNFDGGLGWYIDGISVQDGYSCCTPNADMAMGQSAAPNPVLLGGNVAFTLGITNLGPGGASSVTITDTLPANVTFVSASAGASNSSGTVVWQLGSVSAGVSTNISVTVKPLAAGYFTNLVTLFSSTADPASANNTTTQVVTAMAAPVLTSLSLGGGGISVSVSSVVGVNYQLEYKTFLTDPSWNLLGPAVPGTGGVIILQDTNAPAAASRFYRVACTSNL